MPRQTCRQSEKIHPREWEEILSDVTYALNRHEVLMDPNDIARMPRLEWDSGNDGWSDTMEDQELREQIQQVRAIALKKLKGITQKVILLLISTDFSIRKIARVLKVNEETVRRVRKRGIEQIKECVFSAKTGVFPVAKRKRPAIRVRVFPLDTRAEQAYFQNFMNDHCVVHLSYRGEGYFREVMVVYIQGRLLCKDRKKQAA